MTQQIKSLHLLNVRVVGVPVAAAVDPCPRCRGRHVLNFVRFKKPMPDGYEHWSTCPAKSEPIVMHWENGAMR